MSNLIDFYNDLIPNYKTSSITISNLIPVSKNGHQINVGKGTCSEVYIAKDFKTENKIYAIKHMNKAHIIKEIYTLQIIYNEIEIHSRLNHKNIITLYNKYENDTDIYLIMEFANKGNLYNLLQRKKYFKEKEAYFYFKQVVDAIYYLHSYNIIHRDIKPENLLLSDNHDENNSNNNLNNKNNNIILKLCDFGWCTLLSNNNDHRNTICGTVEYMAPEILNNEEYNKGIDIWALGILLYELCHGYSPFNNENNNKKNKINIIEKKIKESNFIIKDELSFECKDLINKCLIKDLNKRITIEDIIKHPFLKKWENEENDNNNKVNENNYKNNFKTFNNIENNIFTSSPIKNRNKKNLFLEDNTNKPNRSNTLKTSIFKEHKNYNTNNNIYNVDKVKKCVKLMLNDSESENDDNEKNNINDSSSSFDDEKPKKIYINDYKLNELKSITKTNLKMDYPKSSNQIINISKLTNSNESILTTSSNIVNENNNNNYNINNKNQPFRRNSEKKIIKLKMNKIDKKNTFHLNDLYKNNNNISFNNNNGSPIINRHLSSTFTNKNLCYNLNKEFNLINNIENDFPLKDFY